MAVGRGVSQEEAAKDRFFSVRVEPELHEAVAALAERNERSIGAEIRYALKRHVELERRAA